MERYRRLKSACQISVAVLDIDKIKTCLSRGTRRAVEIFDDRTDLPIRQQRIISAESQPSVQDRMMIKNSGFRLPVVVGPAVSPGVRQLETDQQALAGACRLTVSLEQSCAQLFQAPQSMRPDRQLVRIGAASM